MKGKRKKRKYFLGIIEEKKGLYHSYRMRSAKEVQWATQYPHVTHDS